MRGWDGGDGREGREGRVGDGREGRGTAQDKMKSTKVQTFGAI